MGNFEANVVVFVAVVVVYHVVTSWVMYRLRLAALGANTSGEPRRRGPGVSFAWAQNLDVLHPMLFALATMFLFRQLPLGPAVVLHEIAATVSGYCSAAMAARSVRDKIRNTDRRAHLQGQAIVLGAALMRGGIAGLLPAVFADHFGFAGPSPWLAFGPIIAGVTLLFVALRWLSGIEQFRPIEMEESPLKDELTALFRGFGVENPRLLVQPVRGPEDAFDGFRRAVYCQQWWMGFRPGRTVFPSAILRVCEPDALVVGISIRLAQFLDPRRPKFRAFKRAALPFVALFLIVALLLGIVTAWFAFRLNNAVSLVAVLVATASLAALLRLRKIIRLAPPLVEIHTVAYDVWSAATHLPDRTPAAFVAHLASFQTLFTNVASADALVNPFRQSKSFLHFAARHFADPGEPFRIMTDVARRELSIPVQSPGQPTEPTSP